LSACEELLAQLRFLDFLNWFHAVRSVFILSFPESEWVEKLIWMLGFF